MHKVGAEVYPRKGGIMETTFIYKIQSSKDEENYLYLMALENIDDLIDNYLEQDNENRITLIGIEEQGLPLLYILSRKLSGGA